MATIKKCPVCGSSVKPENLERHLKKVHPGEDVDISLSKDEQKKIMAEGRRGVSRREGTTVALIAIVIAVIVIVAIVYEPPPDTMVGEQAPHFAITDVYSGFTYRLPEDFYNKVVFLEIFSTDCPRCQNFTPELDELHRNYGRDVSFISIDINPYDTEQDVRDYVEKFSTEEWKYALDTSGDVANAYEVGGVPKSFIIDLRGAVEGTIEYEYRGLFYYEDIAPDLADLLER